MVMFIMGFGFFEDFFVFKSCDFLFQIVCVLGLIEYYVLI